jgi:hypothetical protein
MKRHDAPLAAGALGGEDDAVRFERVGRGGRDERRVAGGDRRDEAVDGAVVAAAVGRGQLVLGHLVADGLAGQEVVDLD